MRFELELAGKTVAVDVDVSGTTPRVRLDGREVRADAVWISARQLSLLVDGRSYDVEVLAGAGERLEVSLGGHRLSVDSTASGARAPAARAAVRGGVVRAPMPGKVVAVLVEPGDEVEPGQGVIVVEAMKMENELAAETAGRVRVIHARPGQIVESNAPLIEIGPRGAEAG